MGARHKLNSASMVGAIGMAALLGGLTSSWPVFFIAAATLVGTAIYSGDIRGRRRR